MNTFVSGESDAKGLSVILPYIAFGRADVAIRRPGYFYSQLKNHMSNEKTTEKELEETLADLEAIVEVYSEENKCCQWELQANKQRIIALEHAIFRLLFEINPTLKESEAVKPSDSAIKDATELLGLRHMKFDLEMYKFCKQI